MSGTVSESEKSRRAALLAEKLNLSKAVINKGNNYRGGYIGENAIPTGDPDKLMAYDPRTGAMPIQQNNQRPVGNPQERLNNSKLPDNIKESFSKKPPIVSEEPKTGTDQLMAEFFNRSKEITNKIDNQSKSKNQKPPAQRNIRNNGGMRVKEMPPVEDDVYIDDPAVNDYYNNVAQYYQQEQPVANSGARGGGGGRPPIPQQYPQQTQQRRQPVNEQRYYQAPPQPQSQPQFDMNEMYQMVKDAVREVMNERDNRGTRIDETIEIVVGGKSFKGKLDLVNG